MFNNLNNEFKMLQYCFNISIEKTGIIKKLEMIFLEFI
jgi:hypothetical protein